MTASKSKTVDPIVKAYFSALGAKGGKWKGPRRAYVGRLGGLASGAKRRANAKHAKKV